MGKKKSRTHGVAEWIYNQGSLTASGTDIDFDLDLDLLPDEIAEIHEVESKISPDVSSDPTQDQTIGVAMALSMDPDFDDDPSIDEGASSVLNDLEIFYDHQYKGYFQTEGTEANFQYYQLSEEKHMRFDPPLLVGTNIGVSASLNNTTNEFDATVGARVYFTRRKATARELSQVLLKRR